MELEINFCGLSVRENSFELFFNVIKSAIESHVKKNAFVELVENFAEKMNLRYMYMSYYIVTGWRIMIEKNNFEHIREYLKNGIYYPDDFGFNMIYDDVMEKYFKYEFGRHSNYIPFVPLH